MTIHVAAGQSPRPPVRPCRACDGSGRVIERREFPADYPALVYVVCAACGGRCAVEDGERNSDGPSDPTGPPGDGDDG